MDLAKAQGGLGTGDQHFLTTYKYLLFGVMLQSYRNPLVVKQGRLWIPTSRDLCLCLGMGQQLGTHQLYDLILPVYPWFQHISTGILDPGLLDKKLQHPGQFFFYVQLLDFICFIGTSPENSSIIFPAKSNEYFGAQRSSWF